MFILYLILIVLLAAGLFFIRNRKFRTGLLSLFLVLQTILPVYGFLNLNTPEAGGYFSYDPLGIILLAVLTILSYTTVLHSWSYLQHRGDSDRNQRLYFAALVLLIGAMTSVYLAASLGIMWVLIEITTLSVAALIYHERTHLSLEATWKYVFVCTIGITFAFVGIVFLGKALQEGGSVNLAFSDIPRHLENVNSFWLKLAFIFMLVGFSTKMGLFPMHTITVDAHTVAPPPVSAFISTTLMNAGFVAIFRTYALMAYTPILEWMNNILLWSGALSIFVSAVYILKVNHLKRMFAYSTLEHMGITAIGLASGGSAILLPSCTSPSTLSSRPASSTRSIRSTGSSTHTSSVKQAAISTATWPGHWLCCWYWSASQPYPLRDVYQRIPCFYGIVSVGESHRFHPDHDPAYGSHLCIGQEHSSHAVPASACNGNKQRRDH